jgi:PAS domain S-box-containing protein
VALGTDARTGFDSGEPHLQAMLESSLDCVVAIDGHGRVVAWNPAAERTFRRTAADVLLQDMADTIVPPRLRDQHREGLRRYLSGGAPRVLDQRIETVGVRADGTEFPVELTITRIDVPGEPLFVGYLRDISDRVAAEEELRASRARIVAAADAARRRIERDLHDGAQQRLVSLGLTLRLARDQAAEGEDVTELLDEALEELTETTAELRELARAASIPPSSPRAAWTRRSRRASAGARSPCTGPPRSAAASIPRSRRPRTSRSPRR